VPHGVLPQTLHQTVEQLAGSRTRRRLRSHRYVAVRRFSYFDIPGELIYMDRGGDPIPDNEVLGAVYVEEYVERGTWVFASESRRRFAEYREDLTPTD